MKLKFKPTYLIGITAGLIILAIDILYFLNTRWFYALIVLSITVAWLQFWIDFFKEANRQKEIETNFLEFVRSLVGTVKSGIPIPQAVAEVSNEDFGELNPYIKKMKNQIGWGIPFQEALINFSNDTKNPVIKRSISIVMEAERSGGDIENVLDSVTESVLNVKKMKEERKASVHSQIMQGYVVFFVFIAIMLIMQLKLFPELNKTGSIGGLAGLGAESAGIGQGIIGSGENVNLDNIFFSLVIIEGFFTGIMIGKFSEGTIKQGLLHSLVLITTATLIITTIKGGI